MAKFGFVAGAIGIVLASPSFGDDASGRFSDERVAIGRKNGVTYQIGPTSTEVPATASAGASAPASTGEADSEIAGLYAALRAMILGKDRSILEAQAGVTDLLEGETDFYWGGFKVWNSKPEWKDGAFQISAGLPTVSMRAPLVRLPVGPVTLAVDAGVAAEATLAAKLAPLVSIPVQFTSVRATLEPDVTASGFIEGYAKWLIVRAGLGGELRLIRSNAKISGQVGFAGYPPRFAFEGFLSLLAGKIYGFVDYFNVFGWRWKRALEPTFANWKGKCIALSRTLGGADPCVSSGP